MGGEKAEEEGGKEREEKKRRESLRIPIYVIPRKHVLVGHISFVGHEMFLILIGAMGKDTRGKPMRCVEISIFMFDLMQLSFLCLFQDCQTPLTMLFAN